jgi:blue copper oxidase
MSSVNRRRFLGFAAAAGLAGAAGVALRGRRAASDPPFLPDPLFPNALRLPGSEDLFDIVDVTGTLTLVSTRVQQTIRPGKPATLLGYAVDLNGRAAVNPTLRMRRGARLIVRYWNALDEPSIVHWHGLEVDTNNDGHPHYAVGPGETYDYHFEVTNRAGTYWYHPHPHHLAGRQAYLGLAGCLIVEDEEELALQRALDFRLGATDIPLLIQDKRLTADGSLLYSPGAQERFQGYCGGDVLVNLTPRPCFDCESRAYRFRLVNGSNARIYRLAFLHQDSPLGFHVVGSDGGLLAAPAAASEVFLAPGERVDVVLDLSVADRGERVVLASLPFDAMHFSGVRGVHAGSVEIPENGAPLELMLIRVARRTRFELRLPDRLSFLPAPSAEDVATRRFVLDHARGAWRINGESYRMTETAFEVKRGAREVWEFSNPPPAMPHPVHIHGFQYRVLERIASPAHVQALAFDARGLSAAEAGWKDTVLLWPGETVRVLMDFTHPHHGYQIYIVQCHNLEHETHGMMVNFRISGQPD